MSIIYINPYGFVTYDADAQSYITAVEAADGQALEVGVKDAIDAFVVGCKSDGIWSAIKASCILAGARTLAGALVPLVGAAPTNNGFVAGDYNRETGLLGGSGNLESNRLSNADPQNSHHLSLYVNTSSEGHIMGAFGSNGVGDSLIYAGTKDQYPFRSRMINYFPNEKGTRDVLGVTGFIGQSRNSGTAITTRLSSTDNTIFSDSTSAPASQTVVLRTGSARIAFYSIGESIDLALLDTRVTALVNAIGAAIP